METASRKNRTHHVLALESGHATATAIRHIHRYREGFNHLLQAEWFPVEQCEKCWWFDDFWSAADFSKAFQLWILLHTSTSIDSNASIDVCFLVISLVYIRINWEPLHRPAQEMLKSWNSLSWSVVWAPGERTNPSPATQKEAPTLQRSTALERLNSWKCVRAGKSILHGFLAAHSQTNKTSEALMVSSSEARIGAPSLHGKWRGKGCVYVKVCEVRGYINGWGYVCMFEVLCV